MKETISLWIRLKNDPRHEISIDLNLIYKELESKKKLETLRQIQPAKDAKKTNKPRKLLMTNTS